MAGGLTARAALKKFEPMQLMDVHLPTEGGRGELALTRRAQADKDQRMVLEGVGWELPEQPTPRITPEGGLETQPVQSL